MSRRPDRWWMRWYLVRSVPASTAGAVARDAEEYIECATLTRWGARRTVDWDANSGYPTFGELRAVRRTAWLEEHQ